MSSTEVLSVATRHGVSPRLAMEAIRCVPGVSHVRWGFDVDDPTGLLALIEWDSREIFEDFINSSSFSTFSERLAAIRSAPPTVWHVSFGPIEAQHKILDAPVTEIVTFHFAGPPPEGFVENALAFRSVLRRQPGFVELCVGMAVNEMDFEGIVGRVVVALVGWETKEQFEMCRDSDTVKERNPSIRLPEGSLVARCIRAADCGSQECPRAATD